MESGDIILQVQHLSYGYHPGNPVLKDVSVSVRKGEKVAVMGANGAGKSTFFLNLNGVLQAETGEIFLTEPELEAFLHQYRHHLQNVERKYERLGLTMEGNRGLHRVPYENCGYLLRGEDDAIAWVKMIMELVES